LSAYSDLMALARLCLRQASTARTPAAADELRRLAKEYEDRAASLGEGAQLPSNAQAPSPVAQQQQQPQHHRVPVDSAATSRAALLADTPWLDVCRQGCGTSRAIDLRTLDRHPLASVGTPVLGLRCSWRPRRQCRSCWASTPCRRPLYEEPSLDFFFLGQVLGDFVYFLLLLF
jgi:hypothetical protein